MHGELFQDGVTLRAAASLDGVTLAHRRRAQRAAPRRAPMGGRPADAFPKGEAQPFATSVATDGEGTTIAAGGLFTASVGERRARPSPASSGAAPATGGRRVDSTNLAAGHVLDVASFAGGFVAVGSRTSGSPASA